MGQSSFRPPHRKHSAKSFNGRKHIDEMYDKDWERYRARFLKVNRECYACGSLAIVVDHLVPHKGDPVLFTKLDNHIPLCTTCHNFVTTKFDRYHRPGTSIEPKILWLNSRRIAHAEWTPRRVFVLPNYKERRSSGTSSDG